MKLGVMFLVRNQYPEQSLSGHGYCAFALSSESNRGVRAVAVGLVGRGSATAEGCIGDDRDGFFRGVLYRQRAFGEQWTVWKRREDDLTRSGDFNDGFRRYCSAGVNKAYGAMAAVAKWLVCRGSATTERGARLAHGLCGAGLYL